MNTIMIICNSIASHVNKTAEICLPCVNDSGTCWQDVVLVGMKYVLILCIVYWIIHGIINMSTQLFIMWFKRKHEIEDRKWQQVADLKDKMLCHLKECAENKRDEDGEIISKYDANASKTYIDMINQMINTEITKKQTT